VSFDARDFRDALGRFATGVTVVTGLDLDGAPPVGITVNSFAAVSLAPPLVLFSLDRERNSTRHFAPGRPFAVNVLADFQIGLSHQFSALDGDRWRGVEVFSGANGCPLLVKALAGFEGRVEAVHDGGDHTVIVGRVERLYRSENGRPLIFYQGGYRVLAEE
jgi:flavin reductase (DIM6/NTAB) family NADH-FMN oxidoreductase RutF